MLNNAEFILDLLNTPSWLQFIGDKNVHSIEEAKNYLTNGPIKSYRTMGFGLWLVILKETNIPIGICGLVKRESLEDVDIGFALHPDYMHVGYGFEAASATLKHAKHDLEIMNVVAITDQDNYGSIALLNKLGFYFEKKIKLSARDTVLLFSPIKKPD